MSPDPAMHPMRVAREAKGLRLQDLAARIGKSASLLSNIEHQFLPKRNTCEKIAAALDTTIEELWPDEFGEGRS